MTGSRYTYSKYDINMATLRFWGDKPQELLDILHFDTPMGWYVFEGFHTRALSRPFKLHNADEEEIHDDLDRSEVKDLMRILIKAFAESNKSFCVAGMFDFDDGRGERFYFIAPKYITEMHVLPGTLGLDPSKPFEFNNPIKFIEDGSMTTIRVEGKALERLFIIGNYDRDMGMFRCRYESIVDNLTGLSITDQQLVLLVIRVGSGVRYIIAPTSMLSTSESRNEFKKFLQNLGMNSLLVVPTSSEGDLFEFKLDFGEGTPPIDWTVTRSNLLRGVVVRLGVPEKIMNGNEIGLRGAEQDGSEYLQNLELEAMHWEDYIMKALSLRFDLEFDNGDSIKWDDFTKPDEKEQAEILQLKIAVLQSALMIQNRAGMPLDWLLEKLGLDYDVDQSLIDQFEQEKQAMQEGLNNEDDKGDQGSNEEGNGRQNPQLQAKQS